MERKVGQLTVELDLLKKTPHLRFVSSNENSSIISGLKAAPSDECCGRPKTDHLRGEVPK